jgi:structural maintenance of chromosome 1
MRGGAAAPLGDTPASQVDETEDAAAAAAAVRDIDFRGVPKARRVDTGVHSREYQQFAAQYVDELAGVQSELDKIAPNLKAIERFDKVVERLHDTDTVLDAAQSKAKAATDAFNSVSEQRAARFTAAYNVISKRIDGVSGVVTVMRVSVIARCTQIYKELTRAKNTVAVGTAYLSLENTDEPFLAGVKYHAMPPNKVRVSCVRVCAPHDHVTHHVGVPRHGAAVWRREDSGGARAAVRRARVPPVAVLRAR